MRFNKLLFFAGKNMYFLTKPTGWTLPCNWCNLTTNLTSVLPYQCLLSSPICPNWKAGGPPPLRTPASCATQSPAFWSAPTSAPLPDLCLGIPGGRLGWISWLVSSPLLWERGGVPAAKQSSSLQAWHRGLLPRPIVVATEPSAIDKGQRKACRKTGKVIFTGLIRSSGVGPFRWAVQFLNWEWGCSNGMAGNSIYYHPLTQPWMTQVSWRLLLEEIRQQGVQLFQGLPNANQRSNRYE